MKHIINYLGSLLAVVLISATFTACSSDDDKGSANVGLGIKSFFPLKVVTNQPITINGSGFDTVTEIEFPSGVKVTNFEVVSDGMICVDAPSGIAADGGKIIVRSADSEAESPLSLTVGHTKVTGFDKQAGDKLTGGDLVNIYGSDLEFIKAIELLDTEGNPQMIDQKDFYRKGSSNLIFQVPLKNIYKGTFVGYMYTYDGQKIPLLEWEYEPNAGGGHWELQEKTIWDTETVFDGWSATIAIPAENFADVKEGDIIRVYIKDKGGDYNPIFKHVDDWSDWAELQGVKVDEDGYFEVTVPASAVDELKAKGLRFQGVGFTVTKVTLIQNIWIDGGGVADIVSTIWDTETVFDGWSATIVIDPANFADVQEGDLIRIYIKDKGGDYNPIFKHVGDWSDWAEFARTDGEGYFEATVPASAVDELKSSGLRFQGIGFTIVKAELTMYARPTGGGGDDGITSETTVFETETVFDGWSATIVVDPANFAKAKVGNIVRVYIKDKGDDYNPVFKHVSDWADWPEFSKTDGDGYFEAPIPDGALDELQSQGLRFQGIGFTITKVTILP